MDEQGTRSGWVVVALVAFTVSVLSVVQSVGYWILTFTQDGPVRWMFIDHDGPAVTSFLVGLVMLGVGVAALAASRRPRPGS